MCPNRYVFVSESILYAARRPADPTKSYPCFILRRFLPRASLTSAHSRLSALVASSYPESIISSRINYFILNRLSFPACGVGEEGIGRQDERKRSFLQFVETSGWVVFMRSK